MAGADLGALRDAEDCISLVNLPEEPLSVDVDLVAETTAGERLIIQPPSPTDHRP